MDSAAADSAISAAGRYIAFTSDSPDLVSPSRNSAARFIAAERWVLTAASTCAARR